ncbi:MAG: hypothetical protein HGA97_12720 [Chlorobiaceae bacterium]|nr:hypothetical protein [Chlorobiaceae bacterium]
MRFYLTGISCVGKSTIGKIIAEIHGISFFDLDLEIESYFKTSIERLQQRFWTTHDYRNEAAKALKDVLERPESTECVIAMPPGAMMVEYLRVLKKYEGVRVVISDQPENILERLRFYDIDSRPIEIEMTPKKRGLYLKKIKSDITYYRKSYERANLDVDISGLDPLQAAHKIISQFRTYQSGADPVA